MSEEANYMTFPRKESLTVTPEWMAQLRETQPEVTESEAWLLERLIGALGMVRLLMTHGSYMIGRDDAYAIVDEFCLNRYGWKLHWRDKVALPGVEHKAGSGSE